jgi:sodium/potassium-transporting ATPase subunit alpha
VSPEIGLDASAASKRLARNGPNVLSPKKSQYWKKILRYTFGDFCSILWIGEHPFVLYHLTVLTTAAGVIIFFISWKPLGSPPAPYNLALAIVVYAQSDSNHSLAC